MINENKQILQKLDEIKIELDFIKKHVTDFDLVLTQDDLDSLKEAEEDLKRSKTKRL